MAITPQEIEALFQNRALSHNAHAGPALNGADEDGVITEEERTWRTLKLGQAVVTVQQAWLAGSPVLDDLAEKLADGSRDASWRVSIGDSGLLDFFLGILPVQGQRQSLKIHTLRLIGNSCADTDENRARVVHGGHMRLIVNLLADDSLLAFVIPVLYNICVDYEPAQVQASNDSLSVALVDLISGPRLGACQNFLNIITKTLCLLVTQDVELRNANLATPGLLLSLAASRTYRPDLEDYCGLTKAALAYLASEKFQAHLLNSGCFELLQQALYISYTQYDMASADPDEAAQLRQVWQAFVQIFADISALPLFAVLLPLGSPAIQRFVAWLGSPPSFTYLQTAACLSLGNLARSDESSTILIHDVFPPLFAIISNYLAPPTPSHPTTPGTLLHAVLAFVKNLAIAPANKPLIGASLLDPPRTAILPRLWASTAVQPELQFLSVSLARLLILNCPVNAARICAPLSSDPDSPAHSRSNLHKLIDVGTSTDAEPTKIETARTILTVCRMLHAGVIPIEDILTEGWDDETPTPSITSNQTSPEALSPPALSPQGSSSSPRPCSPSPLGPGPAFLSVIEDDADDTEAQSPARKRRRRFHEGHADMSKCLRDLMIQRKWPSVRSEALFVFALMSRSSDGLRAVITTLRGPDGLRSLVEAITGKDMVDGHDLGMGLDGATSAGQSYPSNVWGAGLGLGLGGSSENAEAEADAMVKELGLEPQQADPAQMTAMKKVDRENGLVLVSEVLKRVPQMPPFGKSVFEELLRTGGELVLHERMAQYQS